MNITMNWNELDINEVTNLFLYGTLNTPTDLQDEIQQKRGQVLKYPRKIPIRNSIL